LYCSLDKKMLKRKVIFIGLFSPPITGQSIITEQIYDDFINKRVQIIKLAFPYESYAKNIIHKFRKTISYILFIIKCMYKSAFGYKIIYLSGARSQLGALRNIPIILWSKCVFNHKVILHFHCGEYIDFYKNQPSIIQNILRFSFKYTDKIIILGESLRPLFDIPGIPPQKLVAIPCGIPLSFSPPRAINTNQSTIRLLYLSNLIESKGYFDVLKAVSILHKDYKLNVRCDFCGTFFAHSDDQNTSNEKQAYSLFENYINEHQLKEFVFYHGPVMGEKKQNFLQQADFFLLPTNYNSEGQPVSILEAMSCGSIVISTSYRAIPDMVIDNETGILVPYNKPTAIAHRIAELIQNPTEYARLSKNALNHVQNFSIDKFNSRIEKLFKEVDVMP